MNTKFLNLKRNFLRKLYGLLSLSTVLFVFEACYGSPRDQVDDVYIRGTVVSKQSLQPISGIRVTVNNNYVMTDDFGFFYIYAPKSANYTIKIEDVDSTTNGEFVTKDTTIIVTGTFSKIFYLDVK